MKRLTQRTKATLGLPLGTCWCEHVIPVIEDMEPCPDCMEAYDPHDCPLMLTSADEHVGTMRASVEELLTQIGDDLESEAVA